MPRQKAIEPTRGIVLPSVTRKDEYIVVLAFHDVKARLVKIEMTNEQASRVIHLLGAVVHGTAASAQSHS